MTAMPTAPPISRRLTAAAFGRGGGDDGWVTINGTHVLIRSGKIADGPPHLVGKPVAHLAEHHKGDQVTHLQHGPATVTKVSHVGGGQFAYGIKTAAGKEDLAFGPELSPGGGEPAPASEPSAKTAVPDWHAKVSPAAREAIDRWVGGGHDFIRAKEAAGVPDAHFAEALDAAPVYAGKAWRGMRFENEAEAKAFTVPGSVMTLDASASSSTHHGTGDDFGSPTPRLPHGIVLEMEDARGADISRQNDSEKEVVLRKGDRYAVVSSSPLPSDHPAGTKTLVKMRRLK